MGRLHRLLYHGQHVLAQLIQVHLTAQRGTESCCDPGCVILATIEVPVDDFLETMAQRLEECRNHQLGADDDQGLGQTAGHGAYQGLQGQDEADIECHQQSSQAAIDQGAVSASLSGR